MTKSVRQDRTRTPGGSLQANGICKSKADLHLQTYHEHKGMLKQDLGFSSANEAAIPYVQ
jgi:hypothetical protein